MGKFLFSILYITAFYSLNASAEKTYILEAYGDSTTAGFLSTEYSLDNSPPLTIVSYYISQITKCLLSHLNLSYLKPLEHKESAWPVHLAKLLSNNLKIDDIDNHAITMASMVQLEEQMPKRRIRLPSLAFLLIGANDISSEMPLKDRRQFFEGQLLRGLRKWSQTHTNSTAYVMSIPDLPQIFSSLDNVSWNKNQQTEFTCKNSWSRFFPYTPKLYKLHKEGKLRTYFDSINEEYRIAQTSAVLKMNQEDPKNKYVFFSNKYEFEYSPKNFSVDCFHPSNEGQKAAAKLIYDSIETNF